MKKLVFILITILMLSCSTENKQIETVKDLAKKDVMSKLQLPEGTVFEDKDIQVTESKGGVENLGAIYLAKVTVKSQDKDGNFMSKIYYLNYKKMKEGGLSPHDYELQSFE